MKLLIIYLISFLSVHAFEVDVEVFEKGDYKVFKAKASAIFDASSDEVISGIINFDDKCNNQKRSKRKMMKWENTCKFHNENLVEAVKIKNYKKNMVAKEYPGALFLLWRNISNNGKYSHYDVVVRKDNEEESEISHQMLKESEVNKFIPKNERTVSAFNELKGTYKIRKLNRKRTQVVYYYESETDHWFLKRDFIENKVKTKIESGTLQALKTIQESLEKKRNNSEI